MKLTVLGNNGPFPAAGGACSGYLLRNGTANIMIDCGNGTLANLQKLIGLEELDVIILTHLHNDHISDMHVLKYAVQIKRMRGLFSKMLKVYAPPEPAEEFDRLKTGDLFEFEAINDDTCLVIGGMELSFAQMVHPSMDYAVSVMHEGKKFVYSGDTSWTEKLIGFAAGADLLMLDSGLLEKDLTKGAPHLTAAQCGTAAAKAGAGKLLLTHLWPDYSPDELIAEARTRFANVEVTSIMADYEI